MRVAHLGLRGVPAEYSGVERAVEEIGSRLVESGHEVTIFCMANRYDEKKSQYRGMNLVYVPSLPTKNFEMFLYALPAAIRATLASFDIAHFHALGPSTFSWLPRLSHCRSVVTVHGLDWQRSKWSKLAKAYLRIGEMTAVRFPNATIVVSKVLREYYRQKYGAEVTYVPNGVNAVTKIPLRSAGERFQVSERNYLLYVGRLTREKNIHLLIEAFKRVDTEMKLLIVGGSSHTDDYVRELEALAADDSRITLTGPVYDRALDELYSNAYLFVLPSALEGLPVVLLEALSFGNAILVSDIPENLEVIEGDQKRCGFAFKLSDPEDLTATLRTLIGDPATVDDSRTQGRELVSQKYNWDLVARETEEVYAKLVSG